MPAVPVWFRMRAEAPGEKASAAKRCGRTSGCDGQAEEAEEEVVVVLT